MKPIRFSKVLGQSKTLHAFRVALAVPAVVFTMAPAHAGSPAPDAPSEEVSASNWIGFTIGGAFVSGDDAAMMRRTQTNGDFYGGIDSAQFSHELNDSTTLTLDGHALPGLEDYEFNLKLEKKDIGYVKAGFKQFRTWYDASGGYLEGANMKLSGVANQFDDEQAIDRGEIYFETGLRMDKVPEITFSYRHLYRDGQKDSTSWGDSKANTAWGGVTGSNPAFKFMPAFWDIDERTDIFELDVEHTLGNTDLGLGLVYESYSLDNFRYTPRNGSTPPAAPIAGLNQITQTEKTDADMFSGNIHSVTRFSDKAWLSFAASYSSMDTDIGGGTRTFGAYWPTLPNGSPIAAQKRDYAYDQMSGGSNVGQFITNLNFMWVPMPDLTVTPSLRYENESIDSVSRFHAFNSNQGWLGDESLGAYSDLNSWTEALDVRYTGVPDFVFYAKGQWGQENENILRKDRYMPDGTGIPDANLDGEFLRTDVNIDEQEYTIGTNWYALSNLSFSIQAFHSEREQSLDHYEGNEQVTAANYPNPGGANNFRPIMAEHNTQVDDFNIRMTWRPLRNVSLVTRYDYRHTEFENKGINWSKNTTPASNIDPAIFYSLIKSGDVTSNILSQSATWNVTPSLYVQGSASYISSQTDTPERTTGAADNDYLAGTLSVGYALDKRTDITASYSFYTTSNYSNSKNYNGYYTMGYGLNTQEHAISLTLTRMLTPNIIWNLHYGFITSNTDPAPDQSGGYNDFDAQMVSTGLQFRF